MEDAFYTPPKRIIICYSRSQFAYEEIKKLSPVPVTFIHGLDPELKTLPNTLLIIDDLQEHSDLISEWFTKNSHHYKTDVIYLTQNLFLKTPSHRTASLNAHILVIFKNIRDKSQIMCLARQVSPENTEFIMSAYRQATKKPHTYLLLNLKQQTKDHLRIRDSFFAKESNYYLDKKTFTQFQIS